MFDINKIVDSSIAKFFANFFDELIKLFAKTLANIMGTSQDVLNLPLVQNGLKYAQALAFVILVAKVMNEAFQTYILYQNGDPEADPSGLLVRTAQSIAVIASVPWIVTEIFNFGSKVAHDVAGLSTGQAGIKDWAHVTGAIIASSGSLLAICFIVLAIGFLIVGIQSTIRGAELALMAVLGPIMALNITANNRSMWSAWFKQVVIICTSQALQIFMLSGALSLFTSQSISGDGLLIVFGWLWVTIKTPKFVQQLAYSTGFSGAVGGTAKQAGTMYVMKKMMAAG